MTQNHTTREVAEFLGTDEWRIRRLFQSGTIPEVPRFAGKRAIPPERIAGIVDALRERGWLDADQGSRAEAAR